MRPDSVGIPCASQTLAQASTGTWAASIPEGSQPSARPHHNDGTGARPRQAEVRVLVDVHRHLVANLQTRCLSSRRKCTAADLAYCSSHHQEQGWQFWPVRLERSQCCRAEAWSPLKGVSSTATDGVVHLSTYKSAVALHEQAAVHCCP